MDCEEAGYPVKTVRKTNKIFLQYKQNGNIIKKNK